MVECQLPKLDVAGSNPVSRSIKSITYREFFPEKTLKNEVERGIRRIGLLLERATTKECQPNRYPLIVLAKAWFNRRITPSCRQRI